MIRQGLLCRHCSNKECKDLSTDKEPIEIKCPACNGFGCVECSMGMIQIKGCPNESCSDLSQAFTLFDLFDKGILPIEGGALSQSSWFMDAVRILKNEESLARIEKYE